jgi:hypothetical protein
VCYSNVTVAVFFCVAVTTLKALLLLTFIPFILLLVTVVTVKKKSEKTPVTRLWHGLNAIFAAE